jgi:hypothetical protein
MHSDDAKYKVPFVVFSIRSGKLEYIVACPVTRMEVYSILDAYCCPSRLFHIWPDETSSQLTAESARSHLDIEKECQLVPWVFGKVVHCED